MTFSEIRYIYKGGTQWFVAKDVCEAIGYANHEDALAQHIREPHQTRDYVNGESGMRYMALINFSGIQELQEGLRLNRHRKKMRELMDYLHGAYTIATEEEPEPEQLDTSYQQEGQHGDVSPSVAKELESRISLLEEAVVSCAHDISKLVILALNVKRAYSPLRDDDDE